MCGITGFLGGAMPAAEMRATALRMANTLRHRGPDDAGVWVDDDSGVALSHRRLSILDLSPAGHQPMAAPSGRYVIVFNGEIYNFQGLREEVEQRAGAIRWRGHSDTEVLLAAFDCWGVPATLPRLNGMFAFAVWDCGERALYLARDRMGEKPLYYGWQRGTLLFGSELKALRVHPEFDAELDRDSLALYFRHNCVPAPYTVYRGIWKLPPASYTRFTAGATTIDPTPYWSARQAAEAGCLHCLRAPEPELIETLDTLLRDAVRLRMISDVPLGSFLSGGIDSSLVTALMQAQSTRPVRSFSIGFHERLYDEASDAKAVAAHLGTDHTQLYVTPAEAREVIPQLPTIYDEPFSDSSQIPTYLLARLTRQHVTVALSGDGGDEIFGGYNRHLWVKRIWKTMRWLPTPGRRLVANTISCISPESWDKLFAACAPVLPSGLRHRGPGEKLHKLARAMSAQGCPGLYHELAAHWTPKDGLVPEAVEPPTLLTRPDQWAAVTDFAEQMMYLDSVTYLPDDILVKVDRACMAASLEGRIPYLDHRVVEFAWRLPLSLKIRNNLGKWILRQVLYRYVPPSLVDRPKTGFGIPLDSWFRGPLRDWAESLLETNRLRDTGLDPEPVRALWAQHLAGLSTWQFHIWDVLMLQAWMEQWRQDPVPDAMAAIS